MNAQEKIRLICENPALIEAIRKLHDVSERVTELTADIGPIVAENSRRLAALKHGPKG